MVARCPACGEQLDPDYDWDALRAAVDRDEVSTRPNSLWRFREFLPLGRPPTVGRAAGGTPLIDAPALAAALGIARAWVKFEGASTPSLSFKDRVVSVALNRALELEIDTVGCPSTGNLANALAALAAEGGVPAWIFVPETIETTKILGTAVYRPRIVRVRGTYDDANALCGELATAFGWGIINVNLRAYYGEGSKTMAYEIAEQLGWRNPSAVIAPMGGGLLVTKLAQGFRDLGRLGWVEGDAPRMFGAQAAGCAPIVSALRERRDVEPVVPRTRARSIAIGNPVDGRWAIEAIRRSGGWGAAVDDREMIAGILMLAERSGIFGETASGVVVAAVRRLVSEGLLSAADELVLCVTGNGMKTIDAVTDDIAEMPTIDPTLDAVKALL